MRSYGIDQHTEFRDEPWAGDWLVVMKSDAEADVEQAEKAGYTRCQEDVIAGRGFASFGQLVWHESSYRRGVQDGIDKATEAVEAVIERGGGYLDVIAAIKGVGE